MNYTKVIHRHIEHSISGYAALGSDVLPKPPLEAGGEDCWMRTSTAPRYSGVRVGFGYQGPQVARPVSALVSVYRWDAALEVWQPAVLNALMASVASMVVALPDMPTASAAIVGVVVQPASPDGLPGVYEIGMSWEPVRDGTPLQFHNMAEKVVPYDSGAAEPIASSTPCQSILIQAPESNGAGVVFIGGSADETDVIQNGGQLPAGAAVSIDVDNVSKVYCTGSAPGLVLRILVT